jgi:hypothetical protein
MYEIFFQIIEISLISLNSLFLVYLYQPLPPPFVVDGGIKVDVNELSGILFIVGDVDC